MMSFWPIFLHLSFATSLNLTGIDVIVLRFTRTSTVAKNPNNNTFNNWVGCHNALYKAYEYGF